MASRITKVIRILVNSLITISCITFVVWQSWKCLDKFLQNPTSATIRMHTNVNRHNNLYPAITVCPIANTMATPQEYIQSASYTTLEGQVHLVNTSNLNLYIFGGYQCFSLEEPTFVTKAGIAEFEMILSSMVDFAKVFFHLPGGFFQSSFKDMSCHKHYILDSDYSYEILRGINTPEEPCQEDLDYRQDDCLIHLAHQYSMDKYGCSFERDTECTDMNTMVKTLEIYHNVTTTGKCLKHCTDVLQDLISQPIQYDPTLNVSKCSVNFPKQVKEILIRGDYKLLELLAEIGGYFGLFLGVSFIQVTSLVNILINTISKKL